MFSIYDIFFPTTFQLCGAVEHYGISSGYWSFSGDQPRMEKGVNNLFGIGVWWFAIRNTGR